MRRWWLPVKDTDLGSMRCRDPDLSAHGQCFAGELFWRKQWGRSVGYSRNSSAGMLHAACNARLWQGTKPNASTPDKASLFMYGVIASRDENSESASAFYNTPSALEPEWVENPRLQRSAAAFCPRLGRL